MLRFALLACLAVSIHSTVRACDAAEDDAEPNLQSAYQRAWARAGEERRELLARSQIAWRDYRGANCEMNADRDGWLERDAYAQCLKYMAEARMHDLRLICLTSGDGSDCEPPH